MDGAPGWAAWCVHLAARPWVPVAGWTGRRSPLAWALPPELAGGETVALVGALHQLAGRARRNRPLPRPSPRRREGAAKSALLTEQVRAWLAESDGAPADASPGLECLAWCHALPCLTVIAAETWWALLSRLTETAADAAVLDPLGQPWPQQLLAVELPLTLGWCFPELEPCRQLVAGARRRLGAALDQLLDAQGVPFAVPAAAFRPLLACWARCLAIGRHLDEGHWSETARQQFSHAVRHALRLTRRDGSQAGDGLATREYTTSAAEMLTTAVQLAGDDDLRRLAAAVLGRRHPRPNKGTRKPRRPAPRAGGSLPLAGISSDHAHTVVLRCDWQRGSPLLTVGYGAPQGESDLSLDLSSGQDLWLSGKVQTEIRLDGQPALPASRWESICWESDEAMDYAELELELTRGVRLQRQLLLARDARLLLMADAVTCGDKAGGGAAHSPSPLWGEGRGDGPSDPPPTWEYRARFPLASGTTFEPADETRDGRLRGRGRAAAVIPLALGEWKTDGRGGGLDVKSDYLEYCLAARGRAFYAPLLLDLEPRRSGRPLTWRRLTVAEGRRNQPPDAAPGFRVQIGREQWVVYRSLTGPANRTLLGLNTYSEFLMGRFSRDGECKPILEIEPA
jgi:hypothetical protein